MLDAYSPLGTGRHLPSDTVSSIAQRHGTRSSIFALSDEEMAQLDELDRTGGTDRAVERAWW